MKKILCWLFGHKFEMSDELKNLQDAGIIAGEVETTCIMCGKKGEIKS